MNNKFFGISKAHKILLAVFLVFFLIIFVISSKIRTSNHSDKSIFQSEAGDLTDQAFPDSTNIKCSKLFNSSTDSATFDEAAKWKPRENETYSDKKLHEEIQQSCENFLTKQKYFVEKPINDEEENFTIAFSIVAFKSSSQIERLLRMIYRPWNYYCIHVDTKSSPEFYNTINSLVNCLNGKYKNIVNTVDRVDVKWGQMSVLTADLNCMKELYKRYKDWKYFINLTGQEFPLKTNAEMVKILKTFKGANNLEGIYKKRNENRVPTVIMPFPIVWFKGSVHITVNRDFVNYIFESPKAKVMLEVLKDRFVPDEQFFTTLNFNAQLMIPGSFIGNPDDIHVEFLTRYKNWGQYSCMSKKTVRGICIWGVGDLPKLILAEHLFTNKLHEDFQPATLKCLEKWIYAKVEKERKTGVVSISEASYSNLTFVKYRYVPPSE